MPEHRVSRRPLNRKRRGVVLHDQDPEHECVIPTDAGYIATDAYPHKVSYIRVLDTDGKEIGYWTIDEIKEDPEDVIGAFFGCAKAGVAAPKPNPPKRKAS